ncbi:4331_t:CDS:2 [Acaulospora morrowiae]|uniref:4331_t:CDS:1 n=1 Tax=Acaulospora morrowiae TaxID=94023 RepID=A0A9N9CGK3_9GLOM|nr:4331_t:CDS:2 [Acaulospora morrowiae]
MHHPYFMKKLEKILKNELEILDNTGNARTRVRIYGLFETCLRDDTKDWYETHLKNKNWELQNINDNTGLADLGAINRLANNNALRAINVNQFRSGALHIRNTVPVNNNAIAIPLVLAHTVFDKDWLISGGRPTDLAPNALNANVRGEPIMLSQNDFKKIIMGLKRTIVKGQQTLKKPPEPGKRKANDLAMDHFLDSISDNTGLPRDYYNYDPVEDLRLQFEELDINQAKLA